MSRNGERLLLVARLLVGGLFFYSGLSKLNRPIEYFEIAITMFRIAPDGLVPVIANIAPWAELIFGTYLLLGYWTKGSAAVLTVMTFIFQIVLAQSLLRHLPVDECGCFGGGSIHLTLYQSFMLDTVLALALIQIATSSTRLFSLDGVLLKDRSSS